MQEPVQGQDPPGFAPSAERVAKLRGALASGAVSDVRAFCHDVKAPDLADMIELLAPAERVALIQALGATFDPEVLSELDESVRDQLSEALPNSVLAKAVAELVGDTGGWLEWWELECWMGDKPMSASKSGGKFRKVTNLKILAGLISE